MVGDDGLTAEMEATGAVPLAADTGLLAETEATREADPLFADTEAIAAVPLAVCAEL